MSQECQLNDSKTEISVKELLPHVTLICAKKVEKLLDTGITPISLIISGGNLASKPTYSGVGRLRISSLMKIQPAVFK